MTAGLLDTLPRKLLEDAETALSNHVAHRVEIVGAERVTGGCIHQTARLSTNLPEDFFIKWAPEPLSDVFAAEADGLSALRNSTDLTVPLVIGHSEGDRDPAWLLLEYVPRGSPAPDYSERLGRALADLHEPREGQYGWHRSNYIGSLPQTNGPVADWSEFWWVARLEPQLKLAVDRGYLAEVDQEWAALESRLPSMLGTVAGEGASLVHGDLWSGNVYPGPDGGPVLVDPAAYLGHHEVDLAMTELFGGFARAFYDAYTRTRPLAKGYREVRRHVYQLYPLLVHVNLFGKSYLSGLSGALRGTLS